MKAIGRLLFGGGIITFVIVGIWGAFLCLGIITKAAGFFGLIAAIILTPVTFFAAPLYAGYVWGDWFPLALNYGGAIAAAVLMGIGSKLSDE